MSMLSRVLRISGVFALLIFTAACGALTVDEEKSLGRQVQREVRKEFTLMRDPVVVNYVRGLGAELVRSSRPTPFDVRFYVVEDENINAFAIPGGAIYVHTGLIEAVEHADELAGVVAHEIGHVTARHTAQLARRQRNTGFVAQVVGVLVAILTGNQYAANAGDLAAQIAAQAYVTTYTREYEREADVLAIEALSKSGWNPEGMVRMFETLKAEAGGGGGMPQFLASHPATDERIQVVTEMIRVASIPADARMDDRGKLQIIQRRLELIVGTESDSDPLDQDDEDLEDEGGAP